LSKISNIDKNNLILKQKYLEFAMELHKFKLNTTNFITKTINVLKNNLIQVYNLNYVITCMENIILQNNIPKYIDYDKLIIIKNKIITIKNNSLLPFFKRMLFFCDFIERKYENKTLSISFDINSKILIELLVFNQFI
jgi:hypothetical protein